MTTPDNTLTTTDDPERFRRAGENAAKARRAAYESYSKAAAVVRERLIAVEEALRARGTPEAIQHRQDALAVAVQMKELTERELAEATENWREWVEEARAQQEDARLGRQEKTTTSATWAAWAAAIAAFMSVVVTVRQVFFGR